MTRGEAVNTALPLSPFNLGLLTLQHRDYFLGLGILYFTVDYPKTTNGRRFRNGV